MNLGIAFQLVDDALDYGGKAAKLGKNVGDDFREGKITLPVVLSFRRGSENERAFWTRTLEQGEATDADLDQRDRADDQAPRARGHHRARPALRRDGERRARAVPAVADEGGAGRGGRVLHRAHALSQARLSRASSRAPTSRGCSRASARAAAAPSAAMPNSPKQVAPEPDMRASRQPGCARSAPSTAPITGASAIAGASRSLPCAARSVDQGVAVARQDEPIAAHRSPPRCRRERASAANTSLVGTRDARIDQHRGQRRQLERRRQTSRRCRA